MTKRIDQEYLNNEPTPPEPVVVNCPDPCCPTCGPMLQVPIEGTYFNPPVTLLPGPGVGKKYQLHKIDIEIPDTIQGTLFAVIGDFGTPNALGLRAKFDCCLTEPQDERDDCRYATQELGEGIDLAINAPLKLAFYICADEMLVPIEIGFPFKATLYFRICDMEDCEIEYILPEPPPVPGGCAQLLCAGYADFEITEHDIAYTLLPGIPGSHYVIHRIECDIPDNMQPPYFDALSFWNSTNNIANSPIIIAKSIPTSASMRFVWQTFPGVDFGSGEPVTVIFPFNFTVPTRIYGSILTDAELVPVAGCIPRACEFSLFTWTFNAAGHPQIVAAPAANFARIITGINIAAVDNTFQHQGQQNPGTTDGTFELENAAELEIIKGELPSYQNQKCESVFPGVYEAGALHFDNPSGDTIEDALGAVYYITVPDDTECEPFSGPA
jgi:hypothetical protein